MTNKKSSTAVNTYISEVKNKNEEHLIFLLHALVTVKYFEEKNIKIQLLPPDNGKTGNELFKEHCKQDLDRVRTAIKNKVSINNPYANVSYDIVSPIYETEQSQLIDLLKEKFIHEKKSGRFNTLKGFAGHELENIKTWEKYYSWFPIIKQWIAFLHDVNSGKINLENEDTGNLPFTMMYEHDKELYRHTFNIACSNDIDFENKATESHFIKLLLSIMPANSGEYLTGYRQYLNIKQSQLTGVVNNNNNRKGLAEKLTNLGIATYYYYIYTAKDETKNAKDLRPSDNWIISKSKDWGISSTTLKKEFDNIFSDSKIERDLYRLGKKEDVKSKKIKEKMLSDVIAQYNISNEPKALALAEKDLNKLKGELDKLR